MSHDFWMSDVIWDKEKNLDDLFRLHEILFSKKLHTEKIDALNILSEMATQGSLAAAIYVAAYYDTEKNDEFKEATLSSLKIAASMGSRAATFRMAITQIENGTNQAESEVLLRKLSNDGYLPAKFRLASYLYHKNSKTNRSECLDLLRSASLDGHILARRELGRIIMTSPSNPLDVFIGFYIILSSVILAFPILVKLAKGDNSIGDKLYG